MNVQNDGHSENRSLSVIIPALNEEGNIQDTIDIAVHAASKNFNRYELIVVNDGSTDRTPQIVEDNIKRNSNICIISHSQTQGFGASFNTGRQRAQMSYSVMVHGDNVFEKKNLTEIFSLVGKADVICGYIGNPESRNLMRRLISGFFTCLMNILFGLRLRYFNGIQIHQTEWIKNIHLNSSGFGFQSELLIKALKEGKTHIEVPYFHKERPGGGVTKLFRWRNIISVIKTVTHLVFWTWHLRQRRDQEKKHG